MLITIKENGYQLELSMVEVSKIYRKWSIEKCPVVRTCQPFWYRNLVRKEDSGKLFNRSEAKKLVNFIDKKIDLRYVNWILRKRTGLSQKEACRLIGISRYWMVRYENGKVPIKSEEEIGKRLFGFWVKKLRIGN